MLKFYKKNILFVNRIKINQNSAQNKLRILPQQRLPVCVCWGGGGGRAVYKLN